MNAIKIVYLLLGVGLLAAAVASAELDAVADLLGAFGGVGLLVVVVIYGLAFSVDSFAWTLALASAPATPRWLGRMWVVRTAGEAFNSVLPAAGFGGEPYKAVVMKARYGVPYRDGLASLVLARTFNLVGLSVFLMVGFALMLASGLLPQSTTVAAAAGLAAIVGATVGLALAQRHRAASRLLARFGRGRWQHLVARVFDQVEAFDLQIVAFYGEHRARLAGAISLSLLNWLLGVAETYYTLAFLGVPVSWADATIIEAVTQMVRAGAFFIPLNLGAQEGILVLMVGALTGQPAAGLSAAIVRRVREVVWIAVGLASAALLGVRPVAANDAGGAPPG